VSSPPIDDTGRRGARASAVIRVLAVALALAACIPAAARGAALLPPSDGVFTGLTSGSFDAFEHQVGKHPAVEGVFVTWGEPLGFAFAQAHRNHARLMLHISTAQGYGAPEQITPLGIARAQGDRYLLRLSEQIALSGEPVYIRLFPEMNNANNDYCAFNNDGSYRGDSHSIAAFRQAWRRVVIIERGGPIKTIDAKLHALGMPPLREATTPTLPRSPVAFLWGPQTAGTPDTESNSAAAYYPGEAYVDWVGTDFFSLYPNFIGLERFYREFPGKPFVFGEWAVWGGDEPAFVERFFSFISSHPRVRMALYNQGEREDGPFRLFRYPNSRREIQRLIASPRFLAYAPEWLAR